MPTRRLNSYQRGQVVLTDAYENAAGIVSAIPPFTSADFEAAQGHAAVPQEYATTQRARQKLDSLSEFGLRMAVGWGDNTVGLASLMDKGASRAVRAVRKLGLDLFHERTLNGFVNAAAVESAGGDRTNVSTEVVDAIIGFARHTPVNVINIVQTPELPGKNPDLIVIEHAADLEALGFEYVGKMSFPDQEKHYEGDMWRREVPSPTSYR